MKLILFDVDDTLCKSGQKINEKILNKLIDLSEKYDLGIVGGGRYTKIEYQFTINNVSYLNKIFKYVFTENGMIGHKSNKILYDKNMRHDLGDDKLNKINNYLLELLSSTELPMKTGSFVDLRNGLIYFTPIGQNCTMSDRQQFKKFDEENNVRIKLVESIQKKFPDLYVGLGGEIGICISPKNWNKAHIMHYLNTLNYNEIYFFGDKIYPGGNDYPLAIRKEITKYFQTSGPDYTYNLLDYFS
jgi:phosphomannomutase